MIGMTVVDIWKFHKVGIKDPDTVKEYVNIMTADMIEAVDLEEEKSSLVVVPEVSITENSIDVSAISCNAVI